MAITADALLVADGPRQRLAQRDAHVFDRVMRVDMQIALGLDVEVDQPVPGDLVEHVIKEAHTGGQFGDAGAVEVEGHGDLRLGGVAGNLGSAHGKVASKTAVNTVANTAVNRRNPNVSATPPPAAQRRRKRSARLRTAAGCRW